MPLIHPAVFMKNIAGNDANTVLMLHCNGTNGSTTFTDSSVKANTMTASGDCQITTTGPRFGSGQLTTTTGRLTTPSQTYFNYGSSDFTIDFWALPTTLNVQTVYEKRANSGTFGAMLIGISGNNWSFWATSAGASWDIADTVHFGAASTSVMQHVAVVRSGSNFYGFVNGVRSTITTSASAIQSTTDVVGICRDSDASFQYSGTLDEYRISSIARWTDNFNPNANEYS